MFQMIKLYNNNINKYFLFLTGTFLIINLYLLYYNSIIIMLSVTNSYLKENL